MIASNTKGVHTVENAKKVADKLKAEDGMLSCDVASGKITQSEANKKMEQYLQDIGQQVFGGL